MVGDEGEEGEASLTGESEARGVIMGEVDTS